MGRVFLSPRMGVRETATRWRRLGRTARDRDRVTLEHLGVMAMAHASEGFYAFDDPLEAAVVSVLVDLATAPAPDTSPAGRIPARGCGIPTFDSDSPAPPGAIPRSGPPGREVAPSIIASAGPRLA